MNNTGKVLVIALAVLGAWIWMQQANAPRVRAKAVPACDATATGSG